MIFTAGHLFMIIHSRFTYAQCAGDYACELNFIQSFALSIWNRFKHSVESNLLVINLG